ncbi:MAG: phosphatidylinositol-specific phospholipase C domain-containing protein [Trichocoleus desertorum ATA4-8-CV12]|jgi:GH18 family chitinase|nr:phosphatidylinositol-specific phospholipase C domain-containing protein [Trichocoleus desertorum ATA4-8-CV12]
MGFSQDYSHVPDWVEKPEGYQTGSMVKYEGNVFIANFWASKPGEGDPNENGWRLYDELYDVTSSPATTPARIIGYIPTWRKKEGFNYDNEEMYLNITHGIISFLMFDRNNLGEFESKSVNDVKAVLRDVVLTGHRCDTKISIALGGAMDYGFLNLMERIGNNPTDPALEKAVKNVVDFVKSNDLDGVDLDLECWWDENNDASKDQGGRLKSDGAHPAGKGLTEFAKQLKQAMPDKIISAALFATSWYGNCYDPRLAEYVEWLGIMTYDLTGSWNQSPVGSQTALLKIRKQEEYAEEQQGEWPANRKSSGNATDPLSDNPILSVEDSLWYWTNPFFTNWQGTGQNLKRNKIAAGVPIYGYDFAYGKEPDDLSDQVPPGYKVIRYKDILSQFPDADTAANANIKVAGTTPRPPFISAPGTYPYAHNIYFETPKTATDKLNFLKSVGAQGVIIWELTNDVWENGKSIVKALYQNSGNPPKQAKPAELPLPKDWLPKTWMASIPDSKKLSELTIPGTHDSCTYTLKNGELATPITRTQRLTLEEQLNAGIRFLDIRCRHIENAFAIHHDRVYLHLNFDDVLKVCTAFLTANQNECIVMSVKNEHTEGEGVTRSYEATFDSYLQGTSKGFWYLENTIPTLKDVRGKIVLLRRFGLDDRVDRTGTKGIDASYWPDNTTFENKNDKVRLRVQDAYKVPTILAGDIDRKWNAIKSLLDEAKSDASDTWFINFTSGASAFAYPNAVAGRINHRVSAYVDDKSLSQVRLGTIVTDFPDDNGKTDMVDRIIKVNFLQQ